ncbi:aminodeoxychorismate lyase [Bacillus sp. 1P06AnD]|uniref:aminodeoxychorismate lyase n=1 Tax=Bacillus sp. 1P06AnD TaxID=3132208 RepID=UPI0039A01B39
MIIYVNGEYVREEEARISPFDHGFLYGMGLFETIRMYNGFPFLLSDHLDRLQQSLKSLYIEFDLDYKEIRIIIERLLHLNQLKNARIRLNVTAGEGPVGLPAGPYKCVKVIIFISSLPEAQKNIEERRARFLELRRNSPEGPYRLKSHHYGNNIAAKMELQGEKGVEGLFLDKEGAVAEGIASNIFWVSEGRLFTPDLETGILPGITRQFIKLLAAKKGIPFEEGIYPANTLRQASEVFLTNSIQEIVAIKQIEGIGVYKGSAGPVAQQLFQSYQRNREKLLSVNQL